MVKRQMVATCGAGGVSADRSTWATWTGGVSHQEQDELCVVCWDVGCWMSTLSPAATERADAIIGLQGARSGAQCHSADGVNHLIQRGYLDLKTLAMATRRRCHLKQRPEIWPVSGMREAARGEMHRCTEDCLTSGPGFLAWAETATAAPLATNMQLKCCQSSVDRDSTVHAHIPRYRSGHERKWTSAALVR